MAFFLLNQLPAITAPAITLPDHRAVYSAKNICKKLFLRFLLFL